MPYMPIPLLVARKRYTGGLSGIGTVPVARASGRGRMSPRRFRGSLGSLGDDLWGVNIPGTEADPAQEASGSTASTSSLPPAQINNSIFSAAGAGAAAGSEGKANGGYVDRALAWLTGAGQAAMQPGVTPAPSPLSTYMPYVAVGGGLILLAVVLKKKK